MITNFSFPLSRCLLMLHRPGQVELRLRVDHVFRPDVSLRVSMYVSYIAKDAGETGNEKNQNARN